MALRQDLLVHLLAFEEAINICGHQRYLQYWERFCHLAVWVSTASWMYRWPVQSVVVV